MVIKKSPPEKYDLDRGLDRLPLYASLYRFGETAATAPLVVYVGGANSIEKYLARRQSHPDNVADELWRAIGQPRLLVESLNALFCPCPVDTGGEGFEGFVAQYDATIAHFGLSPSALGCVGFSAGAACAVHLAISERARGAAVFGGVGVAERVQELRPVAEHAAKEGWPGLDVALFRNDRDETPNPQDVARQVHAPIHAIAKGPLR